MSDSDSSDKESYASQTSTSRSDRKGGNQPRVSYSTDYHVDMLEDSQKMKPRESRKPYFVRGMTSKPIPEHTHERDDDADESMDDYVHSSGKDVESEHTKKYANNTNYFANDGGGSSHNTQNNSQIFSKFVGEDDYNTLPDDAKFMKRLKLMRMLGELARDKGITLSQKYNINSDYYMMKYEYNLHKDIIDKQEFTNVATSVMRYAIYGLEKLNENYNTVFDLKLNGWSDDVGANMDKFTSIWGDIYEKYSGSSGKASEPEYRLILALACGGIGYHMNNSGEKRPRRERDPDAEYRNDEEMKKKELEKHKLAERQIQEMARLNEINQQHERLRSEQDKLQREREEFEQFRKSQQIQKQQMMMNSQQYNNINYDARQKQINEQLLNMKQNINQNTIPLSDIRGDVSMTRASAVPTPPSVKPITKKNNMSIDSSSSSSTNFTPKKGGSRNTGKSTVSKRNATKKSGGITLDL